MNKLNCKKYINFGIIGNKNILPMWSWIKNWKKYYLKWYYLKLYYLESILLFNI
jgi:hypothetical protein